MSIYDQASFLAADSLETQNIGVSVANALSVRPITIILRGELGAGKTTFAQGIAKGLGIEESVTSPTYALEQRYGEILSHIDLYRLQAADAKRFISELDEFPGVRLIEWPERSMGIDAGITVTLTEEKLGRRITIAASDIRVPTEQEIRSWYADAMLQEHIIRHIACVANVCDMVADSLLSQKRFIRKNALRAAALTHDLLRFTDFKSVQSDFPATPKQAIRWAELKDRFGTPHEGAAQRFLAAHRYGALGAIVRTHRGSEGEHMPVSTEQIALAYADKRCLNDAIVTVDERFDDFVVRYGNGKKENPSSTSWRNTIKKLEHLLFPDGVPF